MDLPLPASPRRSFFCYSPRLQMAVVRTGHDMIADVIRRGSDDVAPLASSVSSKRWDFVAALHGLGPSQYFGRCEMAHSRACSMGARGGKEARSFLTAGRPSIRSRHRPKAENLGYMAFASGAKLKE